MKKRFALYLITTAALSMGLPAAVHAGEEGRAAPKSDESSLAVCGHLGEMMAARRALEAGDREEALVHLRAARALLVECERNAASEAPTRPERGRDLI